MTIKFLTLKVHLEQIQKKLTKGRAPNVIRESIEETINQ